MLNRKTSRQFTFKYYERPGRWMSDAQLDIFVEELRAIGVTCFDELPDYQCFKADREGFGHKVITVARDPSGRAVGFSSGVLLDVEGMDPVVHLGLSCVHPDARCGGLTHALASRMVSGYMLRHHLFSRVWVTNVACVLSSIGNVAANFDQVFPSPGCDTPTERHMRIARTVSARYREDIYIHADARFDEAAFVFRGSVKGTCFQKDPDDTRYHHRKQYLNDFYLGFMRLDEGDEVIQVGHFSCLTAAGYFIRRALKPIKRLIRPQLQHAAR
ncbi:MAG: hypothetical protein MK101_12625 [Phycisphaerales bacterium]|nr:hypothetical protein [Phycisphaerales bacterium]